MKHFIHKLTREENATLQAFLRNDPRIKAINKNLTKYGYLTELEKIILKQIYRETLLELEMGVK